jgi:hypothetical protein
MRTTVTLDPDTESLVKRYMREQGLSFKQAVNQAIRKGLAPKERQEASFPTYDMGEPFVDITKALQLAGELEDEEILRRMRLGPRRGKRPLPGP